MSGDRSKRLGCFRPIDSRFKLIDHSLTSGGLVLGIGAKPIEHGYQADQASVDWSRA